MYCPVCFNDTLRLKSSGVINLIVNDKQMDAGRFLYNLNMDKNEVLKQLHEKLESFFKWYANFQNQKPIEKVQLLTTDISCETGCRLPLNIKISAVDIIISSAHLQKSLDELGTKYKILIQFDD